MTGPFVFARVPRMIFGPGTFSQAAQLVAASGRRVLLVTGGSSYRANGRFKRLIEGLAREKVEHFHIEVSGEPSPTLIDRVVSDLAEAGIEVVLAWGGGSVIDAGKALAAMLPLGDSVIDYLEDVGTKQHPGGRLKLIAAPTTAGTGSEATKNAVLSQIGPQGFKKSLRHEAFVPDVALIDPELALDCPPEITAACGMDAFTQLLESYVSTQATPVSDALALSGLARVRDSLVRCCTHGSEDLAARADMAYAALLSGVTLANAGLGTVHGLSTAIGGLFNVPHGVACGSLVGAVTTATIEKLIALRGKANGALARYADVGALLVGLVERDSGLRVRMLNEKIGEWTVQLKMPRLSAYGITAQDLPRIAAAASNRNNPLPLSTDELIQLLNDRL